MSLCIITHTTKQVWTKEDFSFVANLEQNVKDTIKQHNLVKPDDKILIAASGGKDSTVLLNIFHKFGIPFEAVTVDTAIGCYTKENLQNLRKFCAGKNIKLHEVAFREAFGMSVCYMRDSFAEKNIKVHSCTVCGVPRRQLINKIARKTGATKIVMGHNLDDEAQAVMMNFIKNRPELNARLGPSTAKSGFVARIKPLYFVREKDIERYSKLHGFTVHYGKCPCVKGSLRSSLRDFFDVYEQKVPEIRENIIKFFIDALPKLKSKQVSIQLSACRECGEPCTNDMCKTCRLFVQLKGSAKV